MDAPGLSVCLTLTLWMTGSCPPTALPPRSLESSFWWGQESLDINTRALALRKSGNLRGAETLYAEGYASAVRRADSLAATRFLMSAGACQLLEHHFQQALSTLLRARETAESIDDSADLGAIAGNLSTLHLQMQDFPAAIRSAEEGLAHAGKRSAYFEPYLLLQLGWLHSLVNDGKQEPFFANGIESARAHGPWSVEAQGWDRVGEARLTAGRLAEAEHFFLEAFRLRSYFVQPELGYSHAWLGALFLARGDLGSALRFTEHAIAGEQQGAMSWPRYQLLNQRARIRLAQGRTKEALTDFSAAMDASTLWRMQALPSRSSLTGLNIEFDRRVFRTFIDTAAEYALSTHDRFWAERAFEAVELNRGASLRESLTLAGAWRKKLPPEYWESLADLERLEQRHPLQPDARSRAASLHLRLTEMEAAAGVGLQTKKNENFLNHSSLIHFQQGLGDSELLLSFSLGERSSELWAVTRYSMQLYRLPAEQDIASSVRAFREALPAGGTEANRQAQQLYRQLFGSLGIRELKTKQWLLSLEGPLFEIPFAALVSEQHNGEIVYLADRHSVQIVPGALLLASPRGERTATGPFVGVGDPIYNAADPRWHDSFKAFPVKQSEQLTRLVGSGQEVEASARTWPATATVLTGRNAIRGEFLRSLSSSPSVIHLATHVIIPPDSRDEGLVAFGLSDDTGRSAAAPQYLSTPEIAALSVPGALVVMSGCSTGIGDVRAGAGILGLTRAWLMAGAGAVVSTSWPQEDTSGEILARFYSYYLHYSAAEALRRSQMEFAHSATWRAAPAYWASYQLTGGER